MDNKAIVKAQPLRITAGADGGGLEPLDVTKLKPVRYKTERSVLLRCIDRSVSCMISLHGHEISGNSYRPRLLLHLLRLEYRWIRVDLMAGEHRREPFLSLNPAAQVPVLVDGAVTLADSHAILVYLARRYGGDAWLPLDAVGLAEVVRWLAFSAGEIKQGPEHARLHHLLGVSSINIERARQKSEAVLRLLDGHLAVQPWLALGRPTIADVAVYPYIHLAPDGQIDLAPYGHVNAWLERVEALDGFHPMEA